MSGKTEGFSFPYRKFRGALEEPSKGHRLQSEPLLLLLNTGDRGTGTQTPPVSPHVSSFTAAAAVGSLFPPRVQASVPLLPAAPRSPLGTSVHRDGQS